MSAVPEVRYQFSSFERDSSDLGEIFMDFTNSEISELKRFRACRQASIHLSFSQQPSSLHRLID